MNRLFYCILSMSLFCFTGQTYSQTPQQIYAALPEMNEWDLSPDIETFNSDNLYECIGDAASLFLENNFQEMTGAVYTSGDDSITVQVYRHETPEDAFGMYSSERFPDEEYYLGIGGEAHGDAYDLCFFAGSVYVKMTTNKDCERTSAVMKKIAAKLARKLDDESVYPSMVYSFPKEGLIPYTAAYVEHDYMGHDFLDHVYTDNYELFGKKFQAFVMNTRTDENAKQIISDFFKFAEQDDPLTEGNLLVRDPCHGSIPIVWKGPYLIGALDESGGDFPKGIYDFLNQFDLK